MPSPKTSTEIDAYIGYRLKRLRRGKELSQTALGRGVNISFQQIQKYELGKNRISASRLWQFCVLLDVTPSYFFDGYAESMSQRSGQRSLADIAI